MYGLKNIEKSTVLTLKEQVAYQPGQVVSKTLAQNAALSVTLFAFDKGEEISTHESGGDAFVTCLDGTGRITIDGVQSNASSSFLATQPLTPVQRSMIMRGVDKVYTTFTNDVAEGRNLPIEKVLDIAGGRVWSGADALGIGLIDTYGGLKTAIALAVDKADLGDNYRVTEVTETPTGFAAFIASLNMSVREAFTRSELGLMMKDYNTVREAFRQQGVLMYSPYKVEIR